MLTREKQVDSYKARAVCTSYRHARGESAERPDITRDDYTQNEMFVYTGKIK